jgi:bacitracin transport system permease protein
MTNLIQTELLKLKRSSMVRIGFAGVSVAPVATFAGYLLYRGSVPSEPCTMELFLSETGMYMVLLIGTPLFGVLATWLFNREFAENTLKSLLPIPVSRSAILASKTVVLFAWILLLSLWCWLLAVALGFVGGFSGGSAELFGRYLARYVAEGFCLSLLSGPFVLATLALRNYVPVIVLAVSVTLVGVMVGNSDYCDFYPWTAILSVVSGTPRSSGPFWVPCVSIAATSVAGYAGALLYFTRMDVT